VPREARGCHPGSGPASVLQFSADRGRTRLRDAAGQAVGDVRCRAGARQQAGCPVDGAVPGDARRHPGRHQYVAHGQETTAPGCPARLRSRPAGPPARQPSSGTAAARCMAAFYHPSLSSHGPLLIAYLPIVHFGKGHPWNNRSRRRRPGKHAYPSHRRQSGHRF
jgi:hypothetical protein